MRYKIFHEVKQQVMVLYVGYNLDSTGSLVAFKKYIEDNDLISADSRCKGYVLEVSQVDMFNSLSMGYITALFSRCRKIDRELAIVGMSKQMSDLFAHLKINELINFYDQLDEAIHYFHSA